MTKQVKAVHLIREKQIKEENSNIFEGIGNIDSENHIIKNVCVFGTRFSANNRIYQDMAISKIKEFTEGAKVFIDHPSKEDIKSRDGVRSLRDWAGKFSNARQEGDKVYADLTVREAYFDLVKDIATLQPKNVGNSINARVKSFIDEKTKVESIVDVASLSSIDLVTSAATTSSLFESTINANLKNTPEVIFTQEYIEMKVEKLFKEAIVEEGMIQDKMDQDKVKCLINDMTYVASNMINDVMYEDDLSIADKKTKVMAIFDDLSKEIKTKLTGMKESKKMELTLEQVKENADIVKAIIEEYKKDQDVVGVKSTLEQTQKWYEVVEADYKKLQDVITQKDKEIQFITEACKEAEKQCNDAKVKLDEIEVLKLQNDKKTYIEAMLEQSKLSKEAKTEVFFSALMKESEVTVIENLITDRVNLLASDGKVKGAGIEFDPAKLLNSEKKVIESKEKLDEVTDAFIKSKKQR